MSYHYQLSALKKRLIGGAEGDLVDVSKIATPPVNIGAPTTGAPIGSKHNIGERVSGFSHAITDKFSNVMDTTKNSTLVTTIADNKYIYIIATIIALVFIGVIIYIIFKMSNPKLKKTKLTKGIIKLNEVTKPVSIENIIIPKPLVGMEYTYSFWIYLEDYPQTLQSGTEIPQGKMIFYRGVNGSIVNANPVVWMDGISNKLYVAIKTKNSSLQNVLPKVNYSFNLNTIKNMNYYQNTSLKLSDVSNPIYPGINKHIISTIDYVPLQRWVNISIVINNKYTIIYMDGEIYSVKSTEDVATTRYEVNAVGQPIQNSLIVEKTEGNIFIGKGPIGGNVGAPGVLGSLDFFNYAISLDEAKKIYQKGPDTGVLSIGESEYGFRTPVYKL